MSHAYVVGQMTVKNPEKWAKSEYYGMTDEEIIKKWSDSDNILDLGIDLNGLFIVIN